MPRKRGSPGRNPFLTPQRGVLPNLPRLKGFPREPRVPVEARPPGETSADLFEARFQSIRQNRYPTMTRPEFMVYEWLLNKYGRRSQGHDWEYTVATLVSSAREGGLEVDFYIYAQGLLVWQVQGEFFHFATPEQQASDLVERLMLVNAGYTVVNMLAGMIEQDVDRVCTAGLRGEQLYTDPLMGGYVPSAAPITGGA